MSWNRCSGSFYCWFSCSLLLALVSAWLEEVVSLLEELELVSVLVATELSCVEVSVASEVDAVVVSVSTSLMIVVVCLKKIKILYLKTQSVGFFFYL